MCPSGEDEDADMMLVVKMMDDDSDVGHASCHTVWL